MSFFDRFWRVPALVLAVALPLAVACADDEGAEPLQPGAQTGSISGTVTNAQTGDPIVGALVGTSPATTTSLTDASGNFTITDVAPGSYAVTASKDGFQSASTTVTVSEGATATANLQLEPIGPGEQPTTGNLNVLVTNRQGDPIEGADVEVLDPAGAVVVSAQTDAQGFALFSDLAEGTVTVRASTTISGIPFRASAGANVRAGETAFVQLTLSRDFGQSVFPNIDGESVTLTDGADIRFVPVPGGDSNPEVDCNIIRTQHMFIAEVVSADGDLVSGVKVEWDLNISENGTITVECPELVDDPAGCTIPTVPGNTGSVIDTDDPDLDPSTARTGMSPSFEVDSRRAVTFTNDDDQTVSFGGGNITVGPGQTWIVITSPVEGVTDVIASTPDIPASDPNCALDSPSACDKEFAIKRWVNWDTRVFEVTWPNNPGPTRDIHDDAEATFDEISEGATVVNVLDRRVAGADEGSQNPSYPDDLGCAEGNAAAAASGIANACELITNRKLFMSEVRRLRNDSPFNLSRGVMVWNVTDDTPDVDFWGEDPGNDGDGCDNGVCNAEHNGPSDDQYWIGTGDPGDPIDTRNMAWVEFDANNNAFDGGVVTQNPDCTAPCDEDDFIGWGIVEVRPDPGEFFCVDVDGDGACEPGASADTFSTAYQRLLAATIDNTNSFRVRFVDDFGEVCGEFTFRKRWVTSRLSIIKTTPGATRRTVHEDDAGPEIAEGNGSDAPRSVKTHTVEVGQTFNYTVTVINDGEVRSDNVRITDTLPRFSWQFCNAPDPGEADCDNFAMRDGHQAFVFERDRPAFDPTAVVYAIDADNDENGDAINECIRGDDGTTTGNAYVAPAACTGIETDAGTIQAARDAAIDASSGGDQVVWIQWFDDQVLARTAVGGGVQSEDTVEVFLTADSELYNAAPADVDDVNASHNDIPGTWCNIATVTDGARGTDNNLVNEVPQSFAADTLCHEVREALLELRKTTEDAVVTAGDPAEFLVEIANNGSATLTDVAIHDTLDAAFDPSDDICDDVEVLIDGGTCTDTGQDGSGNFTFTINIGDLAPTAGFVDAYRLTVNTPRVEGTFCNRVTAIGQTPAGELVETDIACITTVVSIEMDISNDDGFIDDGGVFQSAKEVFSVGDSGEDFVYQVIITNQSAFTATGVTVVDEVAPSSGIFEAREVRSGFPTRGSVSGFGATGFTWDIGDLGPGEAAEIQFTAEALRTGDDVNRVRLTVDQLMGETIDEEPTTIS